MQPITALYFPETLPARETIAELLFFFETVSCYQPTGAEPSATPTWCAGYQPVPLDDKLARLLDLLKDIRGHAGDYYQGYLTTLSRPAGADPDEASVWTLVSNLTREPEARITPEDELLWRAVLHLKLAEQVIQEEREINQGLAAAAERQAQLLKALHGDRGGAEKHPPPRPATSAGPGAILNLEHLTRAWGQLFLRDHHPGQPPLLVTAQPEAADLLMATREKYFQDRPPVALGAIPLPGALHDPGRQDLLGITAAFRNGAGGRLEKFAGLLTAAREAADENQVLNEIRPAFGEESLAWGRALEENEAVRSGTDLAFYCFPDCSFQDLFSAICGVKRPEAVLHHAGPNAILAVAGGGQATTDRAKM